MGENMKTAQNYVFAPTGEHYLTQKDLDEAAQRFYSGDLSEEFALYCVKHSVHAFWINYRLRPEKVKKEEFMAKFKVLVNEMLDGV